MTPKSLLRHKNCVSKLTEYGKWTSFHRILDEDNKKIQDLNVERVVLCSGKVFMIWPKQEKAKHHQCENFKGGTALSLPGTYIGQNAEKDAKGRAGLVPGRVAKYG